MGLYTARSLQYTYCEEEMPGFLCNEFRKKDYILILENIHWQGVESERCASFSQAMKAGKPVYVKAESTLADGLAVPKVGVNAFATAAPLVDKVSFWAKIWLF